MIEHQPACNEATDHQSMEFGGLCICEALRQAEARVRMETQLECRLTPDDWRDAVEQAREQGQRDALAATEIKIAQRCDRMHQAGGLCWECGSLIRAMTGKDNDDGIAR